MAAPEIYTHHLTGPEGDAAVAQALQLLRPHLPAALPLYRRLQFGRFFPATTLLTSLPDLSVLPPSSPPQPQPATGGLGPAASSSDSSSSATIAAAAASAPPWLLAFVDRSCRPETEIWLFASWESAAPAAASVLAAVWPLPADAESTTETTPAAETPAAAEGKAEAAEQDALITAFARAVRAQPLAESVHADAVEAGSGAANDVDTGGFSRGDYGGHAADPAVVLCGAVHAASVPALARAGLVSQRFKVGLVGNHVYLWDVDALPPVRALPEGYRFGRLTSRRQLARVQARTQIPRQERTLAVLPNIGVFADEGGEEDGEEGGLPVAWAFVGLDGSLTSLHVEPELRGKGIAKAVTAKLFQDEMGVFWEEGMKRLAHGYVQVGNEASCRMCDSLGGKADWEVVWVRMDLGLLAP